MSQDNKLRCIVAYRLPGGDVKDGGVVVAKYDYASQYEGQGGSGSLYGGKDKNYADAVAMVIGNDPPGKVGESSKIGGFKVVESDIHHVVYGADRDGICLAVITGLKYPSRVAITMLTELYGEFSEKFGLQAAAATTDSLSKKAKPMFAAICKKYGDPANVDKASSVLGQVENVKGKMSQNISSLLKNTEKAETIAQQSEQLSEQANVFKRKSNDLKKQMRWKNLKMTIILVAIVTAIILIITVPLILKAKRAVS